MNPLSIVLILALPYVMEYERLVAEKKNNPNLCSANNKLTKIINTIDSGFIDLFHIFPNNF
jgi:hypothetical protein